MQPQWTKIEYSRAIISPNKELGWAQKQQHNITMSKVGLNKNKKSIYLTNESDINQKTNNQEENSISNS